MPPVPSFQAIAETPLAQFAALVGRGPLEARITVTGRVASMEGMPAIAFTVTNISGRPLRLWPFQLPWGNSNSIDIAAITADGRELDVSFPIDDPGPEERMVIAPGQTLSGTYALDNIVDALEGRRKSSDVIVLWSYKLRAEGETDGISSGVLVFARQRNAVTPARE